MALMTRSSPQARLADEVFYGNGGADPPSWPIYEDDLEIRPFSYGAFDGSAIDAHGGWIASAIDLTRFLNAVGGSSGTQLLAPAILATMLARPDLPQGRGRGRDPFYALGCAVTPGKVEMAHNGALIFGSCSTIGRLPGGITFALLFNYISADVVAMATELQTQSVAAINAVRTWPKRGLYPSAD